jgi:hypothetical protein
LQIDAWVEPYQHVAVGTFGLLIGELCSLRNVQGKFAGEELAVLYWRTKQNKKLRGP